MIGKNESMNSTTTLENSWGGEKDFYNEHLTITLKKYLIFNVEVQISVNRKFVQVDKLTHLS